MVNKRHLQLKIVCTKSVKCLLFLDVAFFKASISAYKLLTHLGTNLLSEKTSFSVRGFCLQRKISMRPA